MLGEGVAESTEVDGDVVPKSATRLMSGVSHTGGR